MKEAVNYYGIVLVVIYEDSNGILLWGCHNGNKLKSDFPIL